MEFDSVDRANKFVPPHWFFKDVTESGAYQNSVLSRMKKEDIEDFIENAYVR
jgi:CYTH domain-containing protein